MVYLYLIEAPSWARTTICSASVTSMTDTQDVLSHPILIFDGVCGLCNRFVRFVMRRDRLGTFLFVSNHAPFGLQLLEQFNAQSLADQSILLVWRGQIFQKSDAVLCVINRFGGLWPLLTVLRFVPRSLRDFLYDLVARNRYRLFGQVAECELLEPELRKRLL